METEQENKQSFFDKLDKNSSQGPAVIFEEQPTEIFIVIPPDGGWGWIIVVAAFFSFLVSDGMIYTFGIYLVHMSESFGCSISQVALTGAIMTGFFCLTGPFVCALVNRFGCRAIAIVGSFLASISCILTSVSPSIHLTFLTHGFMGGMGFGMIYIPAMIAVGFYFEKWRPLATGIAVCGAGIGGIALPPILMLVLDGVGWRYTFRIMAVLSLGCAFCGLLYKPIIPVRLDTVVPQDKQMDRDNRRFFSRFHNISHPTVSDVCSRADNTCLTSYSMPIDAAVQPPIIYRNIKSVETPVKFYVPSRDDQDKTTSTETIFRPYKLAHNISSELVMSALPSTSSRSSTKPEVSLENVLSPTKTADSRLSTVYEEAKGNKCEKLFRIQSCKRCIVETCHKPAIHCCNLGCIPTSTNVTNSARPLYRDDIFYSASLMFLPEYRKSMYKSQSGVMQSPATSTQKSKSMLEYNMMVTRTITQKEIMERETCTLCSESVKRTLATMLDFSLLKSPSFLLLILNAVFTSLGFYTPYMFIKDRAIEQGVPEHMAFWLISCIGVTNTLGRIACGIISSFPEVGALKISYVSLVIGGMATLLSGLSFNVWMQFGYAALYGLSIACMSALRTIIIVDMLGLQRLTNAIGIILMFQGAASLAGTSISGLLRDLTGDYKISFYFAGACIGVGSLLLIPVRKVSAWEKRRKENCHNLNSKQFHVTA